MSGNAEGNCCLHKRYLCYTFHWFKQSITFYLLQAPKTGWFPTFPFTYINMQKRQVLWSTTPEPGMEFCLSIEIHVSCWALCAAFNAAQNFLPCTSCTLHRAHQLYCWSAELSYWTRAPSQACPTAKTGWNSLVNDGRNNIQYIYIYKIIYLCRSLLLTDFEYLSLFVRLELPIFVHLFWEKEMSQPNNLKVCIYLR